MGVSQPGRVPGLPGEHRSHLLVQQHPGVPTHGTRQDLDRRGYYVQLHAVVRGWQDNLRGAYQAPGDAATGTVLKVLGDIAL